MKYINFFLVTICCVFFTVCSCATDGENSKQIFGKSSESPVFLSCKAVSETEIIFEFSIPVNVTSVYFSPPVQVDAVENGPIVKVTFSKGPGPGEKLTADLLVEDKNGNTVNVLVPFRTRNSRLPPILITELRTEYTKPKVEYVELKTQKAGNLGALRLFIAGNNKAPMIYEFPPIESAENEYITVHLRTIEDTCRDELTDNLDLSKAADSWPTGRDLWVPGAAKLLRKTDAVYLLDQDDNVADAVMISESTDLWWNKDFFAETAEFLFNAGAWKSSDGKICGPSEAVISTGTTNTRTICRDETRENTGTAADWYITATSGATPGRENNPKRYVP